ncbi:Galactose oxidase/kelch, beta-propeller [Akanthomyces lecanii RCEF 1005]|uniref:Galactose oxidase/kelch, beta-propeller n=1 Tax=Akanthomyces lecanii RCEF 1005 TaxID=1081108 RepID=A0A168GNV4_CORDF|nr:Galactose oxidase/kelch, beta-propeller [Akanthomyces lecanii RCEF 1005]
MRLNLLSGLILAFGFADAQFGDWAQGQVNTTICIWNQPRAAIVRDTIYIDGGSVWWTPGLENGTLGPIFNQGNFQGIILSYNLGKPFNRDTNVTGTLLDGSLSKARGGKGNANGDGPVYYDGALLANDAQFFLYGGAVLQDDDLYETPPSYETLEYQAYAYGPDKPLWKPNFSSKRLTDGVTRYIAYGGAASAPSENKAWYFSGLSSPSRGPFSWNLAATADTRASVPSNTLITLDMESQLSEKWTNSTLPSNIKPRANPEVVWVPVGEQGILVVLGGAVYPEWAGEAQISPNETLSAKESPIFMSAIDIYDVANNTWYQQPTIGGPGTRTRGCAVVAPAADRSSFNIYYYGGFDGVHLTEEFNDDVWVLSLPSFTWTKISDGKPSHARAGHKCFLPYPDLMMVVGGYTPPTGTTLTCLEDGPIVLFNITSGEWMDSYDPSKYGAYGVHASVQATIGGDSTGNATATKPVRSGWATPALGDVFATSYDFGKIKTYWPYKSPATNKTESPRQPSPPDQKSKGVPGWIAPVLGVVLGLVLLTGGVLIFCIWSRRVASRRGDDAPSSHEAMSERIFYWAKANSQRKSPTLTSSCGDSVLERSATQKTSSTTAATPSPTSDSGVVEASPPTCHEMEDTQIAELGDTSSPVELHDTGLTTADAVRVNAGFAPLLTTFSSFAALRSFADDCPIPVSSISGSGSERTPSTTQHPSRWPRKMSVISSVSFESGNGTNAHSPSSIVSPIGPRTPARGGHDDNHADGEVAAGASPFKNVMSKSNIRRGLN